MNSVPRPYLQLGIGANGRCVVGGSTSRANWRMRFRCKYWPRLVARTRPCPRGFVPDCTAHRSSNSNEQTISGTETDTVATLGANGIDGSWSIFSDCDFAGDSRRGAMQRVNHPGRSSSTMPMASVHLFRLSESIGDSAPTNSSGESTVSVHIHTALGTALTRCPAFCRPTTMSLWPTTMA